MNIYIMDELEKKLFPYSNIEITIVKKDDILKTIDENILDKEIANELISHLEVRAEKSLRDHKWTGFPYLGSIRIPPGLSDETLNRQRDAKEWAFRNLEKNEYLMFVKQCAYDNHQINKYRAYFDVLKTRAINKNRIKYNILCSNKGKNYAICKITFASCLKPIKTEYEYWFEMNQNNDDTE